MEKQQHTAAKLNSLRREFEAELMNIPGVVGVGIGIKEKNGVLTGETAFRVYVKEKKGVDELKSDELIPKEKSGFKTDVHQVIPGREFTCENLGLDQPIIGGIRISNLILDTNVPPDKQFGLGTLGCFATDNNNHDKNNIVLLSNYHVLAANGAHVGDDIYHPKLVLESNIPKIDMGNKNPIAKIHKIPQRENFPFLQPGDAPGTKYFIDCATAKVSTCYTSCCNTNMGTGFNKGIKGLNVNGVDLIRGVGIAKKDDIVYKVGRVTGRTVGKVISIIQATSTEGIPLCENNIVIEATEPPDCDGFRDQMIFATDGDSGAVIVNDKNEIVGLLWGGENTQTFACHIGPVLAKLNISICTAPLPSPGARHIQLEEERQTGTITQNTARNKLTQLKSDLERHEQSRIIYTLFENHRAEVVWLVNHARPVTVAWHRYHGPAFIAHFVKNFHEPEHQVPTEIKGISLRRLLETMHHVLSAHGSPTLRKAMDQHADDIFNAAEHAPNLNTFLSNIQKLPSHEQLSGND